MRFRQYMSIILFLSLHFPLFVQKLRGEYPDYSMEQVQTIFIEPFALIDIYNSPSIRIGTEYPLNRFYTFTATLGTYGSIASTAIKLEAKRYFNFDYNRRYYLSLQYFYKHANYGVSDYLPDSIDRSKSIKDIDYRVDKFATGISINGGMMGFHKHRIVVEGYVGVGLRYRSAALEDITHDKQELLYHYHESIIDNATNSPGAYWAPEILLGMRIGWRYKK